MNKFEKRNKFFEWLEQQHGNNCEKMRYVDVFGNNAHYLLRVNDGPAEPKVSKMQEQMFQVFEKDDYKNFPNFPNFTNYKV